MNQAPILFYKTSFCAVASDIMTNYLAKIYYLTVMRTVRFVNSVVEVRYALSLYYKQIITANYLI